MDRETACRLLDLRQRGDSDALRRAYHNKLHDWHPDRFRKFPELESHAHEMTRLIIEAYDELSGEHSRWQERPSEGRKAAASPAPPAAQQPQGPLTDGEQLSVLTAVGNFLMGVVACLFWPVELLWSGLALIWGFCIAHRAIVAVALLIWAAGPQPIQVVTRYLRVITDTVSTVRAQTPPWPTYK